MNQYKSEDMFVLADKLKELPDRKSELEERAKANQAELEQVMLALSEQMAASETQSFSRSGLLFYLNSKTYAAAKAGQKFELFDALKKQGFGSLITETVNANSLSAFVREQIEEKEDTLPEWLEDKVNVFEKVSVGVRKAK